MEWEKARGPEIKSAPRQLFVLSPLSSRLVSRPILWALAEQTLFARQSLTKLVGVNDNNQLALVFNLLAGKSDLSVA